MIEELLEKSRVTGDLSRTEIAALLSVADKEEQQALFDIAYAVKEEHVGKVAYFRGLIECSNLCIKDCYYCGIRRSNKHVERFLMDEEEIFKEAMWAYDAEYGSCVIQSGERQDEKYISMIERVVKRIAEATQGEMGITLSLGEQTEEVYTRWKTAGAHRYLLRIETTNPAIYAKIHPEDHSMDTRKECLKSLRRTGYQVGTGVMMGLPSQTMEDLADDILFLKDVDIDMVGMGPYIPHSDTPMGEEIPAYTDDEKTAVLKLGLKMIAVTRIVLRDINIAAATALQALEYTGREQGLKCGANVIMPNLTEIEFRPKYQLYDNKPCIDENSSMCRGCLSGRIKGIGETIGFNERGDSKHYQKRVAE